MSRRLPTALYLALFLILLAGTIGVYREIFLPPELIVNVLQEGKAPTILVEAPSGQTYLINAGKDAGILRTLGAALPFWQRRLDAVILTAAVPDATGGLTDVIRRYHVPVLARPAAEGSTAQETLIANATRDIPVTSLERGERIILGGGAYADVLWPPASADTMKAADAPLVLLLSYGSSTMRIEGAVPARIQNWLAADENFSPADFAISSNTPAQIFISNGGTFVQN